MVYHVLNRGAMTVRLFRNDTEYTAWEQAIEDALDVMPMRICAFCWMPDHWHMVVWPRRTGELSKFIQRVTNRHVQRLQQARGRVGYGHIYQGRFKAFPIQPDEHFYAVVRYVESNAVRAKFVRRAEQWPWDSLNARKSRPESPLLSDWPLARPARWAERVNRPLDDEELKALRQCVQRGSPYGDERWVERTARKLGIESSIRPRGRPRIHPADGE